MRHTNDLGKDPIFPLVLRLAIPTMMAQFVSVLYSIVDRMYIGAGVGSLALAGVGVCAPIVIPAVFLCFSDWPGRIADYGHADGSRGRAGSAEDIE